MAPRGLLSILNDPNAVEAMLAKRFGEMRSHELSPTEQIKYNMGKLQDPGTPGDKRDIYERAGKQVDVASTIPPVGTALGLLDAGYAARQYREGDTSLPEAAVGVAGGLFLPKLKGAYHGTSTPKDYSSFIRSNRDMGTHISTDPNVARGYAMGDYTPNKFTRDWNTIKDPNSAEATAGLRVMPVVADIRKSLKYPGDPVNWQKADNVLSTLHEGPMNYGQPRYMKLGEDLLHVAGKPGKFEGNFEDYLRGKGYDAIQYPHVTRDGTNDVMNSFMTLDPGQVLPRFSPEGQALIKQRGVTLPSTPLKWTGMDQAYWDLQNQGIMGKKALDEVNGMVHQMYAPGSAAHGMPSHLLAPITDVLDTSHNAPLLGKKVADMTPNEYKIYSGALKTAENIYNYHATSQMSIPKTPAYGGTATAEEVKAYLDNFDKQLAGMKSSTTPITSHKQFNPNEFPSLYEEFGGNETKLKKYYDKEVASDESMLPKMTFQEFIEYSKLK